MADPVFFAPAVSMTLAEVAGLAAAALVGGDPSAIVRRVAALDQAEAGDLTFLDNPRYLGALAATRASGCLIARKYADRVPGTVAALVVDEPYRALASVMQKLYPDATRLRGPYDPGETGISPAAHVHPLARLEDGVTVEPGAVIGVGAEIGAGTVIAANAVIGRDVRIGRDCYIGSHASVQFALIGNRVIIHPSVSIGQDGFGFAMGGRGHMKMPQIGRVVIQDDVEIGAGTAIDRGANRDTVIGEGSKIDNQCQIGHNVEIGRHVVIVSQVGISGSSRIADFAVLAGKVGISGHVTVGPGAQVAGASQVVDDVPARAKVMGYPAKDLKEFIREKMALQRLVAAKGAKE